MMIHHALQKCNYLTDQVIDSFVLGDSLRGTVKHHAINIILINYMQFEVF